MVTIWRKTHWHVSGLSVGQVAERMNIAPSAVRWYADHGLLPSERTAGNQRRFYADVLCRVAMIRAAQRVGLSIEEIREALSALTPRQAPTPKTGSASPDACEAMRLCDSRSSPPSWTS